MREIKFRAWDSMNKEMISCNYSKVDVPNKTKQVYYPFGFKLKQSCGVHAGFFELMQYTGLKDKNQREIYEGDIVSKEGAYIIWDNRFSAWCFTFNTERWNTPIMHDENFTPEIIGNIYENPDLIKGKNNGKKKDD